MNKIKQIQHNDTLLPSSLTLYKSSSFSFKNDIASWSWNFLEIGNFRSPAPLNNYASRKPPIRWHPGAGFLYYFESLHKFNRNSYVREQY